MKVLWLCNIVLPELCEEFGFRRVNVGGWLSGMWNALKKNERLALGICVPVRDRERDRDGVFQNYAYYSFPMKTDVEGLEEQTARFLEIVEDFKPDLVHIWGTEYLHSRAMAEACERLGCLSRVAVNIQGLVSVCEKHFFAGLPEEFRKPGNSIADEWESFCRRGKEETEVLRLVKHVIGRTDWDRACVQEINAEVNYHACGEILRDVFYGDARKWDAAACVKHRIFVSQAGYSVKGFHTVVEALGKLKERYADLQVYVAGADLTTLKGAYAEYVLRLIRENGLEDCVVFTGNLTGEEMFEHYLNAHVFLSASTIENSSNSVCEAMWVGTPVVSSFVGGIPTMIEHKKSGYLYPVEEAYMVPYYVQRIFEDDEEAMRLSENGRAKGSIFNDRERIMDDLLGIYDEICEGEPGVW